MTWFYALTATQKHKKQGKISIDVFNQLMVLHISKVLNQRLNVDWIVQE